MDFVTASKHRLTFGRHEGETLRMIAMDERGLKYLLWLSGQEWINAELREALTVYLSEWPIRFEVELIAHV